MGIGFRRSPPALCGCLYQRLPLGDMFAVTWTWVFHLIPKSPLYEHNQCYWCSVYERDGMKVFIWSLFKISVLFIWIMLIRSVIHHLWLETHPSEKVQGSLLWINTKEKESPLGLSRSYSKPTPDREAMVPTGYYTLAKVRLSSVPRITVNWQKELFYVMLDHNIPWRAPEGICERIALLNFTNRNCKRCLKSKWF